LCVDVEEDDGREGVLVATGLGGIGFLVTVTGFLEMTGPPLPDSFFFWSPFPKIESILVVRDYK
jgi:hypothetical protein